jgi:thiamine biosynthesis lipoprotein
LATSSIAARQWHRDGRRWHHIIDPRTGAPAATDLLSATVVARSAVEAEAAAKAALILGRRAGMAWIERHPYLSGMLVGLDGAVHVSDRLARHLKG